jgi:serine/threonine protein kinase/Tol biopolymer transport system component
MSMIGKSLAHYEITAEIGKGGMGEVYQAKDSKLGRDVAIKVLPGEFAQDADRVARFQREAKLLASLNHPNIAAIHGLEEAEGTHFLVMELVEGETLAERIKTGAIPVEESLKFALQIAEALEAAHEKGVIHRDLKPANIKVTPDGNVKVLDFGLAKAYAEEKEKADLSHSPTLSDAATQQGVILGTAAYMSPEQARGKTVDKRTDIWAFGCVLYEILTGKAAFQGEDVTEIIAAVVKSGVNLDLLPANIHPRIREVIIRCLQKDMRRRYSGINDARYEIEQVLADPSGVFAQPGLMAKPRKKLRVGGAWVAAAVVLAVIIAGIAVWKLKPTEPRQVVRLEHVLPEDQQFSSLRLWMLAVSTDGKQVAYSTPTGLYLRSVDEMTAKHIAGTEESVQSPFFSHDGEWIGYYSVNDKQLKKIPTKGGVPVTLCAASYILCAHWRADNTIVFGQYLGDIMRVSAKGGTPETLIKSESEALVSPQILPDEKTILYSRGPSDTSMIILKSLESGKSKELFRGIWARYVHTGHILYWLDNTLYAVPFDVSKMEVTGGYVPIVQGGIFFDISDSGTLAYLPVPTSESPEDVDVPQFSLVWVNRKGQEQPIDAPPDTYMFPKISPDGTKVALTIYTAEQADIWIWDLLRKTFSLLTRDDAFDGIPVWTLDGKRIAFISHRGGGHNIYLKAADGTGKAEQLSLLTSDYIFPSSWSVDGNSLVLNEQYGETGQDISVISMEGDHTSNPLLQDEFAEVNPQVSPDGRWLAYASNESGQYDIYVRTFPDVNGGKCRISTSGGMQPIWSSDGRELFYRDWNPNALMVVDIEREPTFKPGMPRELFRGAYLFYSGHNWDIHPDGKRFLMIKLPDTTEEETTTEKSADFRPRKINIVLNWFEELKEKVPVD